MKERLKSPVLWTSFLALIFFICKNWVGFEIPQFNEFIDLVVAVCVGFGILNNPTDRRNL